jgi:cytochrome oxidase assembly protein ShyY1
MRFLLRPGWLAFIAVVLGFVAVCYAVLAPWQFDRENQREAQQAQIDRALNVAAVTVSDLVPGAAVDPADEWRQVTLTGRYLPEDEGLVRLRVVDGKPAFEVMTPMRLADGRTVAIDRGSVAAPDGQAIPDFTAGPAGTVTVTGRLRVNETDTSGRPSFDSDGHRQIYAADSRALATATGVEMVDGYVQLTDGQPGALDALPVVPPVSGAPFTNFSYALQWITFGAIAVIALGLFIRLELLQRRGKRESRTSIRDALSGRDGGVDAPPEKVPARTAPEDD